MKHLLVPGLCLFPALSWAQMPPSIQIDWVTVAAAGPVSSVPANGLWAMVSMAITLCVIAILMNKRRSALMVALLAAAMCFPWEHGSLQAAEEQGLIELTESPQIEFVTLNSYLVRNKTGSAIRLTRVTALPNFGADASLSDTQPANACVTNPNSAGPSYASLAVDAECVINLVLPW